MEMEMKMNNSIRVGDLVEFRGKRGTVVIVGRGVVGVAFDGLNDVVEFAEDLTYRRGHTEKLEIVQEFSFDMLFQGEEDCEE